VRFLFALIFDPMFALNLMLAPNPMLAQSDWQWQLIAFL